MANLIIIQVLSKGYIGHRFRIIEKVNTIDGIRDRLAWQAFPTLVEAEDFVKHHAVKEGV